MVESARRTPPVLIYDRVDENRRLSRRLVALLVIGTLPVALFVSAYAAVWIVLGSPLLAVVAGSESRAITIFGVVTVVVGHVLLAIALWRYRQAARTILRAVGAKPVGDTDEGFRRSVASLCIGAGLPMPALFVCETPVPNAFVVGHGPEDSALVVSRGLLDALDRLELEGVIAHELAHIGNEDVRLNTTLAGVLRTFLLPLPIRIVFWLSVPPAVAMLFDAGEFGLDPAFRWLFAGQLAITCWVLAWPTLGRLLQHALSRKRELLADAQAVLLTRHPDGLARALRKLEQLNGGTGPFASPRLAHLMILGPKPLLAAFATHPTVATRVAALSAMGATETATGSARVADASAPVRRTPTSHPASEPHEPRLATLLRACAIGVAVMVGYLLFVVLVAVVWRLPTQQWTGYLPLAGFGGFVVAGWLGARASAGFPWGGLVAPVLRKALSGLLALFVGVPVLMMLFSMDLMSQSAVVRNVCGSPGNAAGSPGACELAVGLLVGALWVPAGALLGVFHDRMLRWIARQLAHGSGGR
ncbi:MAG: hypothetical protein RIS35_1070 [Pseudomonadota bacterium]|jgi:heat shock protein HtpX